MWCSTGYDRIYEQRLDDNCFGANSWDYCHQHWRKSYAADDNSHSRRFVCFHVSSRNTPKHDSLWHRKDHGKTDGFDRLTKFLFFSLSHFVGLVMNVFASLAIPAYLMLVAPAFQIVLGEVPSWANNTTPSVS